MRSTVIAMITSTVDLEIDNVEKKKRIETLINGCLDGTESRVWGEAIKYLEDIASHGGATWLKQEGKRKGYLK